jgi:hypothetical protein
MALPTLVLSTRLRVLSLQGLLQKLVQQKTLAFTMQHQTQTNWCWAAVSTSVNKFYHASSTWTQCKVVNAELGQTTCCSSGGSAACNQPWYLDKALARVGDLQSWQGGSVPYATVVAEVNGTRPLGCRIGWSGGGGHFVALYGYQTVSTTQQWVVVGDPWYGNSTLLYNTFRTGYQGTGTWTHTYFTRA